MNRLFSVTLSVSAMIALTGCGGGSSGTGVSSGLDPERIVSTLGTVEYGDICESIKQNITAEFESNKRGFCALGGMLGAFLGENSSETAPLCEEIVSECMSAPVESESDPEEGCPIRQEGLAECQATVRDIEACFGSVFELMGGVLNQFQCGDSIEEFTRKAEAFSKVAVGDAGTSRECEALRGKCASLLINNP